MRRISLLFPVVLGFSSILLSGAVLLAPATAQAQTPVFSGVGLVEILVPGSVTGDGATPVDLYILALNPDGSAMAGMKLKPSVSGGTISDPAEMGGGVYKMTLTPGRVSAPGTLSVSLKGKLGTTNFARAWNIAVLPASLGAISIQSNPAQVVLGQDTAASLSFTVTGGLGTADLAMVSSSGTVTNLTSLGNGQFQALYTPPAVNYPHVAILRVVDRRDPSRAYATYALQLVGRTNYPVRVAPGGRAVIKIGDKQYGPVQADAGGNAQVPIMVPPGVTTATVVSIAPDNSTTEAALNLQPPETKRVALIPGPTAVPGDARVSVPVRAVVVTPDGKPDAGATVTFTASVGQITPARHEGNGVYVATWTPPNGYANSTATISASLGTPAQTDSWTAGVVGARPVRVDVMSDPVVLPVGGDSFKTTVKVTGPDGQGIAGRQVEFALNGAKLSGLINDRKNGEYGASFATTGTGPVELTALVATPASGNPLARVLLIPSRELLPADSLSTNAVTVVTVDEFGYPVANVPVTLSVKQGDGTIPTAVTTGANGTATTYYTSGRSNNLVLIEASANGSGPAAASFVQANGVKLPDLPVSGDATVSRQINEWTGSRVEVRIDRQVAAAAPVVAPVLATPRGNPPARLAMMADNPSLAPGQSTTLRLNLTDAGGLGVAGYKMEFLSSAGTISNLVEVGNGIYTATLTLPADASGEVKISASTADGTASTFVKLQVAGAAAPVAAVPVWGAPAAATTGPVWGDPVPANTAPANTGTSLNGNAATGTVSPATAGTMPTTGTPGTAPAVSGTPPVKAEKPPKPPRQPGDAIERPWFKLQAGYVGASYAYSQQRLSVQSDLYPNDVNVPCAPEDGCGGVFSNGGGLNARIWVPGFRYVGFDLGARSIFYSVDPTPLCAGLDRPCPGADPVSDAVADIHAIAVGRYFFDAGNSTLHFGARLGYTMTDVHVYQASATTIDPNDFFVSGLGVGAEFGADIGPKFSMLFAFTEHLGGFTSPYNTQLNLNLSYALTDHLYLGAGYELSARKFEISSADSSGAVGEIQDKLNAGSLFMGVQF